MLKITSLHARQILDSRGVPTVEADCVLSDGSFGRAAVPSGVSTGKREAVELRDGDKAVFGGKSVMKAVNNVNGPIATLLSGMDSADQRTVDRRMIEADGTENKATLGANAILAVSVALCRARAASEKQALWQSLAAQFGMPGPTLLPVPMAVVIEAGQHSDAGLAFQEFMILPTGFHTFSEALRAGVETYQTLKKLLHADGHVTAVGDEGASAPRLRTCAEALGYIQKAIAAAGYEGKVQLAIDAAASEFCEKGIYTVDGKRFTSAQLIDFYEALAATYPIVSIEDSHSEDDWEGFRAMQQRLGAKLQLVGDDLLVTNAALIEKAIGEKACNAVLIKPNQIGTVTETVDALSLAQKNGWNAIVSHRGGDTEDAFIADFAVAMGSTQIKTTFNRSERTAKYNQLLRIEEELGEGAVFRSTF